MIVDMTEWWAAGLLVALPVVLWWAHDFTRIPGRIWYWSGHHRSPWQWGMLLGLLAGGWPALVIAAVGSRSAVRRDLLGDLRDQQEIANRRI